MIAVALLLQLALYALFPIPLALERGVGAVVEERLPSVAQRPTLTRIADISAPDVTARAAGVWDPASQEFLYERESDAVLPIASVTKLMTALVALDSGVDLDATMTIAAEDNDPEGARLQMPVGAAVTVRDLLAATLIASANNAAEALVRATGVAEADFVRRMNDRAASLGMGDTHFTDVTGLGPKNVSTIRDLAQLAEVAFSVPAIASMSVEPSYDVQDRRDGMNVRIRATNKLTGSNLRLTGGKTGFTDFAGGTLLSRIKGNGEHEVIVVVLGSGREDRFTDIHMIADWVFATHAWTSKR